MQYNQSFCGNGLTNGPFYSSCIAPLQCTQNIYPEIVGEGDVTSIALPDGTIQFFFMPTVKWWSPNAAQCHPIYPSVANPMFANTNVNIPPYNNHVGTWFVRSISNPSPQNVCNPSCQRNEVPRPYYNSDYNMNSSNIGYQVKFHNDNCTSTTDLAYFYPCLRQRDNLFKPLCKETAPVQIETAPAANNTVCPYEVVCSKPCNCCVGAKPMSLESIVEPKLTTKSSNVSADDCSCIDLCQRNKRGKEKRKKRNKSKNICVCDSTANIVSVDKSITTYTDEGCSCTSADGRETQTCRTAESKCSCERAAQNTSSERAAQNTSSGKTAQKTSSENTVNGVSCGTPEKIVRCTRAGQLRLCKELSLSHNAPSIR